MPWLVRDGKVLATLEVATSLRHRTRGLLGRDGIDGAILLRPARSVHTFRMRFPIDVAVCDREARVLRVVTLVPNRITLPVRRGRLIVECEAGMLGKWGVRAGDLLELRGVEGFDDAHDAHGPDGHGPDGHGPDGHGTDHRYGETPASGDAAGR